MARFDVVVVGGGLIGCASAYYLAKAGASVLVVERGLINRGASGRNAGSLHFQLEHRLIRNGLDAAAAAAPILALARIAINDWHALEARLGTHLEVNMQGGFMVAQTAADVELLEAKRSLERQYDLDTAMLTPAKVARLAPYMDTSIVRAASFMPSEGSANPRLVTPAFLCAARSAGARFKTKCEVVTMRHPGDEWRVTLRSRDDQSEETIGAETILNAGGAWIEEIAARAGVSLPMHAMPLLISVTARLPQFAPHLVQHVSENLSVKQVHDGNFLIGGGWPARMQKRDGAADMYASPRVIPQNVQRNVAMAIRLVPELKRSFLLRTWTGITGVTPDELPYLGAGSRTRKFLVAGGGSAFALGPTLARMVSDLIVGNSPEIDVSPFDPMRFALDLCANVAS